MKRTNACPVLYVLAAYLLVGASVFLTSLTVYAQSNSSSTAIASPVRIVGDARDGDLVHYDSDEGNYQVTTQTNDSGLFGVIVDDPIIYLEGGTTGDGVRPVVRVGDARVNVSTLQGEVRAGDLITSSRIPGIGARIDVEDALFVVGYATEGMIYDDAIVPMNINGQEVRFGTVRVALSIGPYRGESNENTSTTTGVGPGQIEETTTKDDTGTAPVDPFKVFRYLLGTFVAISAVVLALRRFGDLFAQSVISVGRNPLARSQIRSILVWNAVLIIIVSSVGLGLGIAIIILPV